MSSYVRAIRHEIPFDGGTVAVTLKPLRFGDMLKLKAALAESEDTYLRTACELLPGYVESVAGLTDAAGAAVSVDEMCTVAFFMPVVFACTNKLIAEARVPNPPKPGNASTATLPGAEQNLTVASAA